MIGKKIKQLRHNKDMTQETLAEYLNISPQAVSRWETDLAMPDISVIPVLANIFDVTTDYLLGVDITNKEKEINEILQKARGIRSNNPYGADTYAQMEAVIKDGLKKYPNNYSLQLELANMIGMRRDTDEKTKNTEIVKICESILAGCTDNKIRNSATDLLCLGYFALGEKEKAVGLAESLPSYYTTSSRALISVQTGAKKGEAVRDSISTMVHMLKMQLFTWAISKNDEGVYDYTKEEQLQIIEKIIELEHIFYEAKEYERGDPAMAVWYNRIAWRYAGFKDADKALEYFEKAQKLITNCVEPIPEDAPVSLLNRFNENVWETVERTKRDLSDLCANKLSYELPEKYADLDFLREDERFKKIVAGYKKYAKIN